MSKSVLKIETSTWVDENDYFKIGSWCVNFIDRRMECKPRECQCGWSYCCFVVYSLNYKITGSNVLIASRTNFIAWKHSQLQPVISKLGVGSDVWNASHMNLFGVWMKIWNWNGQRTSGQYNVDVDIHSKEMRMICDRNVCNMQAKKTKNKQTGLTDIGLDLFWFREFSHVSTRRMCNSR